MCARKTSSNASSAPTSTSIEVSQGRCANATRTRLHMATSLRHREVARLRMVKHQRRDRRLGLHHAAVGELHADLLGPERLEELLLILEARAGGVAERVT